MNAGAAIHVVVADDDPDVLRRLTSQIAGWGYRVTATQTRGELLTILSRERPVLVLLDLRFGEADGLELLRQIRDLDPDLPVALLTAHGSIDTAVSAMRGGAYDFLTKPPDLTRLRVLIAHAAEKQSLAVRLRKLEAAAVSPASGWLAKVQCNAADRDAVEDRDQPTPRC
ncbi:MAG: response regulator [Gemmataceae bacterium]